MHVTLKKYHNCVAFALIVRYRITLLVPFHTEIYIIVKNLNIEILQIRTLEQALVLHK